MRPLLLAATLFAAALLLPAAHGDELPLGGGSATPVCIRPQDSLPYYTASVEPCGPGAVVTVREENGRVTVVLCIYQLDGTVVRCQDVSLHCPAGQCFKIRNREDIVNEVHELLP